MNRRFASGLIVRAIRRSCVLLSLLACFLLPLAQAQIKREILPDGIEHWSVPKLPNGQSRIARRFEEIYDVVFAAKSAEPFGRSIAFLVGVANYRHLSPQLPSVQKDIAAMRDFLLNRADFDEVYVAMDDIVTRDRVEQYVKGILPATMRKNDRLLFYYSGHGGDNRGKTGYMLFSNAQEGQFYGEDVLAVDTLNSWSHELPMRHILFILDSCASGMGIDPKSGTYDSDRLFVQTLSGNGSRTVLTAGTADEATYADERPEAGNSFFTKAFLTAFESRSESNQKNGFITIGDLFAEIELEMARFRMSHGKPTTPRMWKLQEPEYRGTFVFLNPRAKATPLTADQVNALGAAIVPKREDSGPAASDTGTIEVYTLNSGYLDIDGQPTDWMTSGETRQFFRRTAAKHLIEFQAAGKKIETRELTVERGETTLVGFGLKPPIDDTGAVPVGTLRIFATHGLYGKAYIDYFNVGRLEKNGTLTIEHLTAGPHDLQVFGDDQTQFLRVDIRPNQTTSVVERPFPPRHLTATVQ